MKESELSKSIKEYLEYNRCLVYRMNSGSFKNEATGTWIRGQAAGTPDLCVGILHEGLHILGWVEVKIPKKGNLSEKQIFFLKNMDKLHCPWLVAESIDDAKLWLSNWDYHGNSKYVDLILNMKL